MYMKKLCKMKDLWVGNKIGDSISWTIEGYLSDYPIKGKHESHDIEDLDDEQYCLKELAELLKLLKSKRW